MPKGIYERKLFTKKHRENMSMAKKGKNNSHWKGGITKGSDGYVYIRKPDHPRAKTNGYIKRSHLVAEKKLGRYLYPDEIPHHKNEIRNDDRPENIEVMTEFNHKSFHGKNRGVKT